ncbi:uncharacterized protein GIQ15_03137 [Arthroderma uncinatum]|uniref:uncharacterized protein n=1 Tax=Arthroderma uncinatum TaxID=74035 RepID=UPI00144A758D|nr:uncharacterized protein GIQ15_03137 [Arthroderma uncinatum]KAF3483813.1 hypothetical protein GIQ15_03137 [Arthroderma uncinatum]
MFAFAPAFPQPTFSPRLASHHQFAVTATCPMSDQNTPITPKNRSSRDTNHTNQFSPTPFTFSLSSPAAPASPAAIHPASSPSHFAQRYAATISRPAARVTERQSRETRRDAFLNRVKRGRRANQFDARSDQIQRNDFLEQQKRFEEEMAKSGPQIEYLEDGDEDEAEEYLAEQDEDFDEALLEDFIAEEENEYMALVEDAPGNGAGGESLDSDMFDDDMLVELLDRIESKSHHQMDTSGS